MLARETQWLARLLPAEAVAVLLLVAGGLAMRVSGHGAGLVVVAVVVAFVAFGHWLKIRQNSREQGALRGGLRGETQVAQSLARELDDTHYIFNDLTLRSGLRTAQIDPVVVGPRGIFVVETKNWGGRITGRARDATWIQTRDPAAPPRRMQNPLLQNARHAAILRACLRAVGAPDEPVIPVLVFVSPRADAEVDTGGFAVLGPRNLPGFISSGSGPVALTEPRIDAVVARLREFA